MVSAQYEKETTGVHQRLAADYTFFYEHSTSDSPKASRRQLIDRVLPAVERKLKTQSMVYILDMGAGRQVLEYEMQFHPLYQKIGTQLKIITVDIARLTSKQLLTHKDAEKEPNFVKTGITIEEHLHITANGTSLPLASGKFDMVISSMAIDFMPREDAFREVARVLKPDAEVFINFHHPNLITQAEISFHHVTAKLRSARQAVEHGKKSRKYEEKKYNLRVMQQQEADLLFILNEFPHLIFHSSGEIIQFVTSQFPSSSVLVEEITDVPSNGWFAATILLGMADSRPEENPGDPNAAPVINPQRSQQPDLQPPHP